MTPSITLKQALEQAEIPCWFEPPLWSRSASDLAVSGLTPSATPPIHGMRALSRFLT